MGHVEPEYMRRVCNRCGACAEHERHGILWSCSVCGMANPDSDDLVPRKPTSTIAAHRAILEAGKRYGAAELASWTVEPREGWLARSLDSVARETADWPAWKREAASREPALALPAAPTREERLQAAGFEPVSDEQRANNRLVNLGSATPPTVAEGKGNGVAQEPSRFRCCRTCDAGGSPCDKQPGAPSPQDARPSGEARPTPQQRFDALEHALRQRDEWHRKCEEARGELGDMQTRAEQAEQRLATIAEYLAAKPFAVAPDDPQWSDAYAAVARMRKEFTQRSEALVAAERRAEHAERELAARDADLAALTSERDQLKRDCGAALMRLAERDAELGKLRRAAERVCVLAEELRTIRPTEQRTVAMVCHDIYGAAGDLHDALAAPASEPAGGESEDIARYARANTEALTQVTRERDAARAELSRANERMGRFVRALNEIRARVSNEVSNAFAGDRALGAGPREGE